MPSKMLEIDPGLHQRFIKVVALQGKKVKDATAEAIRMYLESVDYGALVRETMNFEAEGAGENQLG